MVARPVISDWESRDTRIPMAYRSSQCSLTDEVQAYETASKEVGGMPEDATQCCLSLYKLPMCVCVRAHTLTVHKGLKRLKTAVSLFPLCPTEAQSSFPLNTK